MAVASFFSAAIYVVPELYWAAHADETTTLIFCLLLTGMMSGGGHTLSSVPVAAFTFVWVATAGVVMMYFMEGQPALAVYALIFGLMISASALGASRKFNSHYRAIAASREKGRIIELLRELGASGSNWFWELDADNRIVTMSDGMVNAIGTEHGSPIGRRARDVLDPEGQASSMSSGMQSLLEHAAAGTAFRDVAIPVLGGTRWWSLSALPLIEDGQLIGWRGVGSDITETRLTGQDAVGSARRDPLTGLANRLLIREIIEEALMRQVSVEGGSSILLLLDLDRFKPVNDTLGHAIGDQLLVQVARRLERAVAHWGRVGRLGGDEFAIVISGGREQADVANFADRLIDVLSSPFYVGEAKIIIGASVGIAHGPDDGCDDLALLRSADLALYRAKQAGRGTHCFYEPWLLENAQATRLLESDVRSALTEGQLSLVYQPIVASDDGRILAREALLRWHHPERGAIAPDEFIPIVEDLGLIGQIGSWVIHQACAEAASWPFHIRVAVNVSAAQLKGSSLSGIVISALAASGLSPAQLELEVTESIFLGDDPSTLKSLSSLQTLGVRLVLDDFGKGYSSFGYLTRARFSKIKIDQSFVRAAASGERESGAIVHAILALAKSLGVETTAEGVETNAQAEAMRAMGCSQLQGFLFGRPAKLEPSSVVSAPLFTGPSRRVGGRR